MVSLKIWIEVVLTSHWFEEGFGFSFWKQRARAEGGGLTLNSHSQDLKVDLISGLTLSQSGGLE
jgi:hypothetical protein